MVRVRRKALGEGGSETERQKLKRELDLDEREMRHELVYNLFYWKFEEIETITGRRHLMYSTEYSCQSRVGGRRRLKASDSEQMPFLERTKRHEG